MDEMLPEMRLKAEQEVARSRKYNELMAKKNALMASGKFLQAMAVGRQMSILRKQIVDDLVSRIYKETINVNVLIADMNPQDQMEIKVALNTIIFTIDLIETCVMTTNEILKKYKEGCKLEMYDKLIDVLKEAHKQMQFVGMNDTLKHQEIFADIADELTDMIFNKVKKYMNRKKQEDGKLDSEQHKGDANR